MWLVGIIIGLLIGWNLPQPAFAKAAQLWVVTKVKGLFGKAV
jgi:hypothetical protein